MSTPRGRRTPAQKLATVNTPTPPEHYLPRQSLFDRNQVFSMMESSEDDENTPLPFYGGSASHGAIAVTRPSSVSPLADASSLPEWQEPSPDEVFRAHRSRNSSINFVQLFQEQQAMLQKIGLQQEKIQKQQEEYIKRQEKFEEKIADLEEQLLAAPSAMKRRERIPRQLSVCFIKLT